MSDFKATVSETKSASGHAGFHVTGYEKIEYGFTFIDGIFDPSNTNLADCYKKWGRCLAVTDQNIYNVYGKQMEAYFQHHGLELKIHKTKIGEKVKTMPTLLSIVDSMNEFGIYRKVKKILLLGLSNGSINITCRSQCLSLEAALSQMLLGKSKRSIKHPISNEKVADSYF